MIFGDVLNISNTILAPVFLFVCLFVCLFHRLVTVYSM